MKFAAKQIAEILGATIEGDPEVMVDNLSRIEEGTPGTLTFLGNPKYTPFIYTTKASLAIVPKDFVPDQPVVPTLLRVENPHAAFARLLEFYNTIKLNRSGISPQAYVSPTARLGKDVYIGEFAVISDNVTLGDRTKIYPNTYVGDNTRIGDDTTLFAGVKIYSDNVIGNQCILHSGVVIGCDGFGYSQDDNKVYHKIPQIGNVVIEDRVEIGANSTVDRSVLGSTIIHSGVKIDNLVQIAHNCEVGENTIFVSQSGMAGSSKIGSNCQVGGQVGIVGHLSIANNTRIAGQSGVEGNIKQEGTIVMGSPAFEFMKYKRASVHFRNLSQIVARLEKLEKIVNSE